MRDYLFEDKHHYKKQALKAAKELNYGNTVIRKIKAANTDGEIARIMMSARKEGDSIESHIRKR